MENEISILFLIFLLATQPNGFISFVINHFVLGWIDLNYSNVTNFTLILTLYAAEIWNCLFPKYQFPNQAKNKTKNTVLFLA